MLLLLKLQSARASIHHVECNGSHLDSRCDSLHSFIVQILDKSHCDNDKSHCPDSGQEVPMGAKQNKFVSFYREWVRLFLILEDWAQKIEPGLIQVLDQKRGGWVFFST